jgi:hypothetical protein
MIILQNYARQQEVIQNHENGHVRNTGQGEDNTENIKGLNLAVKRTTVHVSRPLL